MKFNEVVVKHSYLLQIFLSLFLLLYIPAMIMGAVITRHSFKRMRESNHAFYMENTQNAAQQFKEVTASFIVLARKIGMEHKISQQMVESNAYEVIAASEHLSAYHAPVSSADDLGIYFAGADYVLTSRYKYRLPDFALKYAGEDAFAAEKIQAFFQDEFPHETYLPVGNDDTLLYGVPIFLSSNVQKDSIVFFVVSRRSLEQALSVRMAAQSELVILNEAGDLLFCSTDPSLPAQEPVSSFLRDADAHVLEYSADNGLYLYKVHDEAQGLTFLSIVPQAAAEASLLLFYHTLQTILLLSAIMLIVILVLIVLINYRPIFQLSRSIREEADIDRLNLSEIRLIQEFFRQSKDNSQAMSDRVNEQQIWLIDHLLHALLQGDQVTDRELELLRLEKTDAGYAIAVIRGVTMGHVAREAVLESLLREKYPAYIVDFPTQNQMAFFLILQPGAPDGNLREIFGRILAPHGQYRMGTGSTVDEVAKIRDSYLEALVELEDMDSRMTYHAYNDRIVFEELYPADMLIALHQHTQQGNSDSALESLATLTRHIDRLPQPETLKRYACYQILNEIAKILHGAGKAMEATEFYSAVNYVSVPQFQETASGIVREACQEIQARREQEDLAFVDRIIQYVDEHCMEEQTTLMMVADTFNVSIYTMSRLFKEATGHRFKEYITTRRLEYGKHLLLTTDYAIKEIAVRTGLVNADYFSRVFRQRYGVSPSRMRDAAFQGDR